MQRINVQGPYCPWPKKQAELKKQVDYYNLLLHEERDISILDLMHSFMQDAPQLILQLYILAKRPPNSKSQNDYIITGYYPPICSHHHDSDEFISPLTQCWCSLYHQFHLCCLWLGL